MRLSKKFFLDSLLFIIRIKLRVMSKSIFIVSGDASGDVYGAQLINALKRKKPDIEIAGLGGDRMAETGMVFLYNLVKEFSVMGFIPVVLGIPKVMRFLEITLDYFDIKKPDLVVLIDYPGFNLYLATHTKKEIFLLLFMLPLKYGPGLLGE